MAFRTIESFSTSRKGAKLQHNRMSSWRIGELYETRRKIWERFRLACNSIYHHCKLALLNIPTPITHNWGGKGQLTLYNPCPTCTPNKSFHTFINNKARNSHGNVYLPPPYGDKWRRFSNETAGFPNVSASSPYHIPFFHFSFHGWH